MSAKDAYRPYHNKIIIEKAKQAKLYNKNLLHVGSIYKTKCNFRFFAVLSTYKICYLKDTLADHIDRQIEAINILDW